MKNIHLALFSVLAALVAIVSARVHNIINENSVVIFSKEKCPWCVRAKNLLDSLSVEYVTVELDKVSDGRAIFDDLLEMTGQKTVPNIFVKGAHVGGFTDLDMIHKNGELQQKLGQSQDQAGLLKSKRARANAQNNQ